MAFSCRTLAFLLLMTVTADWARADFIVGMAAGAGTAAVGGAPLPAGFNGKLTTTQFQNSNLITTDGVNGPPSTVATNTNDYSGPGAGNGNFVNFSLDVFAMNAPMDVVFTVQPATSVPPAGDVIGSAEYFFTVTLKNRLNDNGIQPAVSQREIGGFRVDLLPGVTGAAFDAPQNPDFDTVGGADPFPLKFGGLVTPTSLQYGGLSGGGGGLGYGNALVVRFSVDVPGSSNITPPRNFTLRFTANPEPGSLVFAGLLGCIGAFYAHRRRRTTAESEAAV